MLQLFLCYSFWELLNMKSKILLEMYLNEKDRGCFFLKKKDTQLLLFTSSLPNLIYQIVPLMSSSSSSEDNQPS